MTPGAETPDARLSSDRRRLRLTFGPMDVILTAEGAEPARLAAFERARAAFGPLLGQLVAELPRLRSPAGERPTGEVARAMTVAVAPFGGLFVTPMAAVAGAVADHLLSCALVPGHGLDRLIVNNGGDIAFWQARGALRAAICDDPETGRAGGRIGIPAGSGIGGVATSGWRGRSFSLGIADAVTVLAGTAAGADAAATLIANAVDLPGHPAIQRQRALDLSPDSDLGELPVVIAVGPLTGAERDRALASGLARAREFQRRGLIRAAYLALGESRVATEEKELILA